MRIFFAGYLYTLLYITLLVSVVKDSVLLTILLGEWITQSEHSHKHICDPGPQNQS